MLISVRMSALKSVVVFQSLTWLAMAVLFLILSGTRGGVSAFLGGAVCALPAFLVVAMMEATRKLPQTPLRIFVYEFLKVSLIILGFFSVALFYKDLNWLSFIISSAAVLLSHVFALASRR